MIKHLLTALTFTTLATPVLAQSNMTQHQQLWSAIESVGVDIVVNEAELCHPKFNGGKKFFGWYHGPSKMLVICQEIAIENERYNGEQQEWSEEDLDTLRHESHHLVQDCRDNTLNQELHSVYTKPVDFAYRVLGHDTASSVLRSYNKASDKVKVLELEAFAVAQMNDPLEQVQDIKRYCF